LSVLVLVCQFVTAGQLFHRGGPLELHATGAVVLHLVTGLTALGAVWHQRATHGPRWPAILAGLVFVLTFVQAYFGDRSTLAVHVPGALVLSIGTVWIAAWSFTVALHQPRSGDGLAPDGAS
jgi:peptidoglycan/LPS O-acetylase OafA/YrhL